jgi:drug/metabolite transporter (DMT)-like permease
MLSSLLLMATPILAPVWANLALDEPLGPRHWLGIALVPVGIEGGRRSDAIVRPAAPVAGAEI